eukprot:Gb_26627 [translate_table: standard]
MARIMVRLPVVTAATVATLHQGLPLNLVIWAVMGLTVISAIVFSCIDTDDRRKKRRRRPSAWTGGAYGGDGGGHHHGGGDGGDGGGGYLDGGGPGN